MIALPNNVENLKTLPENHSDLKAAIQQLQTIASGVEPGKVATDLRKEIDSVIRVLRQIRRPEVVHHEVVSPQNTLDPDLVELNKRLGIVRDRVRGVADHGLPGFYLYGRAGTAKTYTVRTTLDSLGCDYEYHLGHLTPIGLFELLEENSTKVIVLDDVSTLFAQPKALGILLAGLGKQPNGKRIIKYKRQGKTVMIDFTGGIIAISNLELHGDAVVDALKSRVQTLNYDPSDEQIIALMRAIASKENMLPEGGSLSPKECGTVTEFLIDESKRLGIHPDVRMQVDKAFRDYCQWKADDTETHWKDLIVSTLKDRLIELTHSGITTSVPTKKQEKASELELLEKITKEHTNLQERLEAFMKATGKGRRTCQRRMRELKAARKQPKAE
jgi:hypothetical protein